MKMQKANSKLFFKMQSLATVCFNHVLIFIDVRTQFSILQSVNVALDMDIYIFIDTSKYYM